MTTSQTDRVMPALQPVAAELLRRADAEAQQLIADAQDEANRIVEQAGATEADNRNGTCRGQTPGGAGRRGKCRLSAGDARDELVTQDDVYRQWRQHATEAVQRLRDEPEYPRWRDTLQRAAWRCSAPTHGSTTTPPGESLPNGATAKSI